MADGGISSTHPTGMEPGWNDLTVISPGEKNKKNPRFSINLMDKIQFKVLNLI